MKFVDKLRGVDSFGSNVDLNYGRSYYHYTEYKTVVGAILTIWVFCTGIFFLGSYGMQVGTSKGIDIVSITEKNYHDTSFEFGGDDGLRFALRFSSTHQEWWKVWDIQAHLHNKGEAVNDEDLIEMQPCDDKQM